MARSATSRFYGPAALVLLGVFFLVFKLSESRRPAEAQDATDTRRTTGTVVYSASYVNQVAPADVKDPVKEVVPFPGTPVFLVRTPKVITVWERNQSGLKKLLDIQLNESFEKLHFLDDGRTFIIQTSKAASVYSINRTVVDSRTR